MPHRGQRSTENDAKVEAALQAACTELNNELKAKPDSKPSISAAARRHSVQYTTLRNRFQGHTQSRRAANNIRQLLSPDCSDSDSDLSDDDGKNIQPTHPPPTTIYPSTTMDTPDAPPTTDMSPDRLAPPTVAARPIDVSSPPPSIPPGQFYGSETYAYIAHLEKKADYYKTRCSRAPKSQKKSQST